MGFKEGQFPQAEQYYKEAISIPMYPSMTENQQNEVVAVLEELLV
jgi:dTDP-4-amino-4,6-dideoxygalactose transaminase